MVKERHVCTCTSVCDPMCMSAPLHRKCNGQRRTESAHCWALICSPISSLAHSGTMMGRTVSPMWPCPSPTPLRPPLTSSPRDDPPSVCRSPDQQPRQYTFHHSGPQCLFHKLSQALGLKGGISTGFGLCKHTHSYGWKQSAPVPLNPPLTALHPLGASISGAAEDQECTGAARATCDVYVAPAPPSYKLDTICRNNLSGNTGWWDHSHATSIPSS